MVMSALVPNLVASTSPRGCGVLLWLARRDVRVLVLIPIIWGLNLLDLLFTRLAYLTRDFVELNPLASHLGGAGQTVFKLGVLAAVTVIFVCLRRRRSVEVGCYLLLGAYGVLAFVWLTVFPFLLSPCLLERLWHGY